MLASAGWNRPNECDESQFIISAVPLCQDPDRKTGRGRAWRCPLARGLSGYSLSVL